MSSKPERPTVLSSGFARHSYVDVEASLAPLPVPGSVGLPQIPRVAASYPTTELQHLSLPTATLVFTSVTSSHPRAQSNTYLAMTWPSDIRHSCNAVVGDERRRSCIESYKGPLFQTAAWRLPHLAPRHGKNLGHSPSWPQCLSRGRHPVWDGHLPLPARLHHWGNAFRFDTGGGGHLSPKFRRSEAGVVRALDVHERTHVWGPARFKLSADKYAQTRLITRSRSQKLSSGSATHAR